MAQKAGRNEARWEDHQPLFWNINTHQDLDTIGKLAGYNISVLESNHLKRSNEVTKLCGDRTSYKRITDTSAMYRIEDTLSGCCCKDTQTYSVVTYNSNLISELCQSSFFFQKIVLMYEMKKVFSDILWIHTDCNL